MLGKAFARFVEKRPIAVLVRGVLEPVLGAAPLETWWARTAPQPYTRTVLCATVYDVLSPGVLRSKPSGRAASRDHEETRGVSLIALDHHLNGVEPQTSAAVVRARATALTPLIAYLAGARAPWVPGYCVNILDGNGLEARDRRLKAWREGPAAPGRGTRWSSMRPHRGW